MAQAQIVGGSYRGGDLLWNMVDTVYSGSVRGVGGRSLEGNVAAVQIVSEAQTKSFLKATATGLAGAALAGPVGAVAGIVAGGNGKEVLFSCQLHHGGQFIAKGDTRIFELLLAESMKPRCAPIPAAPVGPRGRSLVQGSDFPPGSEVILNNGAVRLYQGAATPLLLSGRVTGLQEQITPSASNSEVRFSCRLRDGRTLVAEGDANVYDALLTQPAQGKGGWIFLVVLLVLLGLGLYFKAPLTDFVMPS